MNIAVSKRTFIYIKCVLLSILTAGLIHVVILSRPMDLGSTYQRKWFIRENRFIFCSMTINDNALNGLTFLTLISALADVSSKKTPYVSASVLKSTPID